MCKSSLTPSCLEKAILATIPRAFPPPSCRKFIPVLILSTPPSDAVIPEQKQSGSAASTPRLFFLRLERGQDPPTRCHGELLQHRAAFKNVVVAATAICADGARAFNMDRRPVTETLSFASARKPLLKRPKSSNTHLSRDGLLQHRGAAGEEWVGASHHVLPRTPGPPSQRQELQRPDPTSDAQSSRPASSSPSLERPSRGTFLAATPFLAIRDRALIRGCSPSC